MMTNPQSIAPYWVAGPELEMTSGHNIQFNYGGNLEDGFEGSYSATSGFSQESLKQDGTVDHYEYTLPVEKTYPNTKDGNAESSEHSDTAGGNEIGKHGTPTTASFAEDENNGASESESTEPATPIYIWVIFGDTSPTSFDPVKITQTLQQVFDDAGLNVNVRVQVTTHTDTDLGLEYDRGYYDTHMDWLGNRLNPTGWVVGVFHWPYIALTEDVLSWNGRIVMDNNIGVIGSTAKQDRPTTLKPAKIDELVNRARDNGKSVDYTNMWCNVILHEQIWLGMLGERDHNGAGDLTDGGGHLGPLHSIPSNIADMIRDRLEME